MILGTSNGGDSWTVQNSSDCFFRSLFFTDKNHGWAVGFLSDSYDGILYKTDDGGSNWQAQDTTGEDLHDIYFTDADTGYICGGGSPDKSLILKTTNGGITSMREHLDQVKQFKLSSNYPNPFNPSTTISWQLAVSSEVELSIYNILGKKVVSLITERQQAGTHQIEWDATGFASVVYYYRLITGAGFVQTKKLILLK